MHFFSKTEKISSDDSGESDVFCADVSYKPFFHVRLASAVNFLPLKRSELL